MTEFELHGVRYTPEAMRYNGTQGYLWHRRELVGGAWVLDGRLFLPKGLTQEQVVEEFDGYDNTGCN